MYKGTKIGWRNNFYWKRYGKSRSRMENGNLEISFDFQTKVAFNHWLNKNNIRWNLSSITWIWIVSKNQVDHSKEWSKSFFSRSLVFFLEHKSRLNDRCFDSSESMECSSGSFLISRLSQLVDQAANDRTIFFAVVFDMWQGFHGVWITILTGMSQIRERMALGRRAS